MNIKVAEKWVKKLKSGKYVKGTGYLKYEDGFENDTIKHCCLGVACEMYSKKQGKGLLKWKRNLSNSEGKKEFYAELAGEKNNTYLPEPVKYWIGLSFDQCEELANVNDNKENDNYKGPIELIERYISDEKSSSK